MKIDVSIVENFKKKIEFFFKIIYDAEFHIVKKNKLSGWSDRTPHWHVVRISTPCRNSHRVGRHREGWVWGGWGVIEGRMLGYKNGEEALLFTHTWEGREDRLQRKSE